MNNENLKDISKRPDFKEITAKGGRNRKGSKNIKTVLKELLSAQDPDGEWANPVVKKLLQLAFNKGDYRALVEIIDRVEGKPNQEPAEKIILGISLKTNDGKQIDLRGNTT